MKQKRAQYVWAALAAAAVLVLSAGIILAPLMQARVHAQGPGTEFIYITFADDFENPAWTAANWMYGEGECQVVADSGGGKMMHLVDVQPPSGITHVAWTSPQNFRSFLTDNFVIRTRLRLNGLSPGGGPREADAGFVWGFQQEARDIGYACYYVGLWENPGHPESTGITISECFPDHEVNLGVYVTPIGFGVWHDVEVRSTDSTYEVWLDGAKVLEAPHTPTWGPGIVGLYADGDADFDEFHMEARPANPGRVAMTGFDWDAFNQSGLPTMGIVTMDADGSNQTRLTSQPGNIDYVGAWSPDGSRIAFWREQVWQFYQYIGIYVMDADGSNPVNVSAPAGNPAVNRDAWPAWCPDGQWIAFESRRDGTTEIYKMRPDGTSPISLTMGTGGSRPAWSPDATKIAYEAGNDIWVMDADGGNRHNLTNSPLPRERCPAWSPDGSEIAYVSDFGGYPQVWIMNGDGANRRQITSFASDYKECLAWSPDGLKLGFTGEWNAGPWGTIAIEYIMNPDGTNMVQITPDNDIWGGPAWHPLEPEYPRQVAIPSVWGPPGVALAVPVYVTPVRDVGAIQIDLRYDPSLLTPVDVTLGELVNALPGWQAYWRFDPGRAQAIVYNSLATPVYGGAGPIMYVNFLVNPAAVHNQTCPLDLRTVVLSDGAGNPIAVDAIWDGLFTVWTVKGDLNGDDVINVLDVMRTVNIILGNITPEPWEFWAADMNGDDEVNVQDIILIINRIFDVTPLSQGKLMAMAAAAQPSGQPVVVGASWGTSASGNPVLAITLDNAAGVAGAQIDVAYNPKRVRDVVARGGGLIAAASDWNVFANKLGGVVRVLAFSGSAQALAGGAGAVVELEFLATGKGNLADIAAVMLTDAAGNAIPVQIGPAKPGGGKGRK